MPSPEKPSAAQVSDWNKELNQATQRVTADLGLAYLNQVPGVPEEQLHAMEAAIPFDRVNWKDSNPEALAEARDLIEQKSQELYAEHKDTLHEEAIAEGLTREALEYEQELARLEAEARTLGYEQDLINMSGFVIPEGMPNVNAPIKAAKQRINDFWLKALNGDQTAATLARHEWLEASGLKPGSL